VKPDEFESLMELVDTVFRIDQGRDDLLDWLITTTRPVTVLGTGAPHGTQSITRYRCTINLDGKIHPDRLREMRNRNYL